MPEICVAKDADKGRQVLRSMGGDRVIDDRGKHVGAGGNIGMAGGSTKVSEIKDWAAAMRVVDREISRYPADTM